MENDLKQILLLRSIATLATVSAVAADEMYCTEKVSANTITLFWVNRASRPVNSLTYIKEQCERTGSISFDTFGYICFYVRKKKHPVVGLDIGFLCNKGDSMKRNGAIIQLFWIILISFFSGAVSPSAFAQQSANAQRNVASEAAVCKNCHAERVESYLATKHGQSGNLKGPDCQACHGDASAHVKAGGGKGVGGIIGFNNKAVPAEKKSAVCLSCHENNRHLAFWDSGAHKKNDVVCSDCHVLHGKPGPGASFALKKNDPTVATFQTTQRQLQYETCTSCHKQIRSQLLKPSHHPIIEGKVACSDCHNPHGALSKHMVNAESIPQLCTTCHSEKRGPFIWGHPPVEENCLTCHNSHGANHARLLAEKPPNVCQDCHDAGRHPGSIYDGTAGWNGTQNNRLLARGCTNCHYMIHGSNAPAAQGKFFLR